MNNAPLIGCGKPQPKGMTDDVHEHVHEHDYVHGHDHVHEHVDE